MILALYLYYKYARLLFRFLICIIKLIFSHIFPTCTTLGFLLFGEVFQQLKGKLLIKINIKNYVFSWIQDLHSILKPLAENAGAIFKKSQKQMSGNFEAIIKNMQNQIQIKNLLTWKPASKFIEFAFEEGGLRPFSRQQEKQENLGNGSPRKSHKHEEQEQEELQNSYQPSNQVIDFQKAGETNEPMNIIVTGQLVVDEFSQACVFVSKSMLPTIRIFFNSKNKGQAQKSENAQKSKYVELFLAQKSHSSQYQKYKIIKGGIKGAAIRQKIKNENFLQFSNNRFNYYLSNPEKLPRLILVQYEQFQNKRIYKSIMISEQFSVIESHKVLAIQNNDQLKLYFQPIQTQFLDKSGGLQIPKINTLNKHKIIEQMSSFENYLIKKNKKIWNLIYAAYKYSHIADLYFLNAEGKTKKQQFLEMWKQVVESLRLQQVSDAQKTCNHLDPSAKFVLKIHSQMRNARFIINKQFTKYLSIIASEAQFDNQNNKWVKFDNLNQMKEAYIVCQTQIQAKIISEPPAQKIASSASQIASQANASNGQSKKQLAHHLNKNEDEDFNQQDVEDEDDDVQYEGQSSQNYSVSNNKKRGRKIGQKKNIDPKKQINQGLRQNKYSTRGGNRTRLKQDTQDSNDKKANIAKKLKQKQSINRSIQPPVLGAPPFRVLTPAQAGQYKDQQSQSMDGKMIGLIPMMNPMVIGQKKPEQNKNPTGMAIPKGMMPMMMPSGVSPQLMAMMGAGGMPSGMQIVPMGNGMQAVMMPVQVDKSQQPNQQSMQGMQGMTGMGMGTMGGMGSMGGMGGMGNMIPFMMGAGGGQGMPQGFMLPMMQQQPSNNANAEKSKQTDSEKQKHQNQKKDQKKDVFPPPMMQAVDLSKMGMIGQLPNNIGVMPGGQMAAMQIPQMMQMGMGGLGGMMGSSGMPQGIMMNPLMGMQKSTGQNKQQGGKTAPNSMQNPMFGGAMPFMMAQMPNQIQAQQQANSQNSNGMQLGMMGQFPGSSGMLQMPGAPSQGGMPMGYTMVLNPEQARSMNPSQLQQMQMQLQMQMMMGKGMMPGMMQMPKNDQNDQSKK